MIGCRWSRFIVSGEGWFQEPLEVGGKGDGVLELLEPLKRRHVAWF